MTEQNTRIHPYETLELVKRFKPTELAWKYQREYNRDILHAKGELDILPNNNVWIHFSRDKKRFGKDSYDVIIQTNEKSDQTAPFVLAEARDMTTDDFRDCFSYLDGLATDNRIFNDVSRKIQERFGGQAR